jgi:uncharacterized protein YdhG (YjbR/CyaY superfamily)
MPKPASVDEYIAAAPEDRRAGLESLRAAIRAAAPEATELISYQMPAFKTHGQFLVSYAAFQAHFSLFPASDAVTEGLGEELAPFLAGKGTIRFPADRPIPEDLVTRITKIRLGENAARERERAR